MGGAYTHVKNVRNNRPGNSPGKLKKQNASNGRKTHTPAKPDKNETRPGSLPAAYTIPSFILQATIQNVKKNCGRIC